MSVDLIITQNFRDRYRYQPILIIFGIDIGIGRYSEFSGSISVSADTQNFRDRYRYRPILRIFGIDIGIGRYSEFSGSISVSADTPNFRDRIGSEKVVSSQP